MAPHGHPGKLLGDLGPGFEISVAECFGDPDHLRAWPEESLLLPPDAVAVRAQQFNAARWCAHQALRRLGRDAAPLLYRQHERPWIRRSVQWPRGTVGSITHCAGYQGAAAALTPRVAALGIDAEVNLPLPTDVRDAVLGHREIDLAARLSATLSHIAWDRAIFALKEALFKAWSSVSDEWLELSACRITPNRDGTAAIEFDSAALPRWPLGSGALRAVWRVARADAAPGLVGAVVVAPASAPAELPSCAAERSSLSRQSAAPRT